MPDIVSYVFNIPASDNRYDLGSSLKRWRDLYLAKTVGSILFSDGSKITEDNANLYWDNVNKRLGIGINSPSSSLHINGTGWNTLNVSAYPPLIMLYNIGVNKAMKILYHGGPYTTDSPQLLIRNQVDVNLFSILDTGNVGIGTTSPETHLHIENGKVGIRSSDSSWGQLQIGHPSGGEASLSFISQLTSFGAPPSVGASGTAWTMGINVWSIGLDKFGIGKSVPNVGLPYLTIDSSGNVGIGTTSPAYTLDVNGSLRANPLMLTVENEIGFVGETDPKSGMYFWIPDYTPYAFRWGKGRNLGTWTPLMVLTNNGRLGIGTTNPQTLLDINGNLGIGGVEVINASRNIVNLGIDQPTYIYNPSGDNRHIIWVAPTDPFRALDFYNYRAIGGENTYDTVFYTKPSTDGFSPRLRIKGGADIVDVNIENAYLNIVNQGLKIGGTEVIDSSRNLKNVTVRRLYTADETEVYVTGTTETEVKHHRIVQSSQYGYNISKINVIAELKVSGGTGTLKVYVDGNYLFGLSTTSTTYTLVQGSWVISPAWSDNTIHDVSIRLVNDTAGQTTYNRLYELYVEGLA